MGPHEGTAISAMGADHKGEVLCDAIASERESDRCLASEGNVPWESVAQENGKDDIDSIL
jgi:hypothetical protein